MHYFTSTGKSSFKLRSVHLFYIPYVVVAHGSVVNSANSYIQMGLNAVCLKNKYWEKNKISHGMNSKKIAIINYKSACHVNHGIT